MAWTLYKLFGLVLTILTFSKVFSYGIDMPTPFARVLSLESPQLEGRDVVILQNLLKRAPVPPTSCHGYFDKDTEMAVAAYQRLFHVSSPELGVFEEKTAQSLLDHFMYDGYQDDGKVMKDYKFKVYVPVHKDRNIETTGVLYDSNNTVRYKFTVRTHGSLDREGHPRNQLTTNGNTPTGLMTFDLNSPEPNAKLYGPYPVLRAVKGQKGNAAIGVNSSNTFISDYRNGILLHTGEWENWNPSKPMPNSNGCLHCHPEDLKKICNILVNELGVKVNPNPFNSRHYPFTEQGILSVEQIDSENVN